MRQWSGLPYEILISIFEEVGNCPKDLQSCQLTCKNWSKAAHTQLYSSIQLSDSTSVKLFLEQLPNTGKLVKSIHFFGKFYQPCLNEYAFVRIFQACPNVEVISAPGIQNIWLDLQRQREQGHLQAVKQLIMPGLCSRVWGILLIYDWI
jgi:hypothetical protein